MQPPRSAAAQRPPDGEPHPLIQDKSVCHHSWHARGQHRPQFGAARTARLLRHPVPCHAVLCHATLCRASVPVGDGGQQGTRPGADLGCGSAWAAAVCPSPGARCHTRQVVLAPGWCHGQAGERQPLAWPLGADVCSGSCVYPRAQRVSLFAFLRFPLQLPLRAASCSPSCGRLEPGAAEPSPAEARGHRTVPGREVAHPWGRAEAGIPFPRRDPGFIPLGGLSRPGQRLTCRQRRCRGGGAGDAASAQSPGLGRGDTTLFPRALRGCGALGKGEGAVVPPEPDPSPSPSDGEVALPLPALTPGFLPAAGPGAT